MTQIKYTCCSYTVMGNKYREEETEHQDLYTYIIITINDNRDSSYSTIVSRSCYTAY